MLDQKFKFVYITYKEGHNGRFGTFSLVTDIQYHNNYIVIEYYGRPDSTDTRIIMTDTIEKIDIEDMRELDAKREWVEMNNAVCGHDFTRIKFFPFDDSKSEIHIYPLYGRQDGSHLVYTTPVSNFGKDHYDNLTDFLKDVYEIDCYQWLSPQHQEWVKDVIIKRFEDNGDE